MFGYLQPGWFQPHSQFNSISIQTNVNAKLHHPLTHLFNATTVQYIFLKANQNLEESRKEPFTHDACLFIRCLFIYQMLVFSNAAYLRFCMMIFANNKNNLCKPTGFFSISTIEQQICRWSLNLVKRWHKISQSNTLELHMPPCRCHY